MKVPKGRCSKAQGGGCEAAETLAAPRVQRLITFSLTRLPEWKALMKGVQC